MKKVVLIALNVISATLLVLAMRPEIWWHVIITLIGIFGTIWFTKNIMNNFPETKLEIALTYILPITWQGLIIFTISGLGDVYMGLQEFTYITCIGGCCFLYGVICMLALLIFSKEVTGIWKYTIYSVFTIFLCFGISVLVGENMIIQNIIEKVVILSIIAFVLSLGIACYYDFSQKH